MPVPVVPSYSRDLYSAAAIRDPYPHCAALRSQS